MNPYWQQLQQKLIAKAADSTLFLGADGLLKLEISGQQDVQLQAVSSQEATADELEQNEPAKQCHLLVVARRFYFETTKDYKIADKRDLDNAIALELDDLSPYPNYQCYFVRQMQGEGAKVHFWFVSLDAIQASQVDFQIVVPESLLFWQKVAPGEPHRYDNGMGGVSIGKSHAGYFMSHWEQHLLLSAPQMTDVGSHIQCTQQDYIKALPRGVAFLLQGQVKGFAPRLKAIAKAWFADHWIPLMAYPVGVLFAVGLLQSLYLQTMQWRVDSYQSELGEQLNQNIRLRSDYAKTLEQAAAIESTLNSAPRLSAAMSAVATAVKGHKGLEIKRFQVQDGVINMLARAPSATDVLVLLTDSPHLVEVEFASGIRAEAVAKLKYEQFTIRARLQTK